ncbi:serine/threonine protein kinase [Corallococcus sp. H22C18031201]|nr:serine/threonine protein kinase [Corallococcus sp. H22C18031201]
MSTTRQACPNCGVVHDTRVYVSGQKVACRCGIRFEVRRNDVSLIRPAARLEEGQATLVPHPAEPPAQGPAQVSSEASVSLSAGSGVFPAMDASEPARAGRPGGDEVGGTAPVGGGWAPVSREPSGVALPSTPGVEDAAGAGAATLVRGSTPGSASSAVTPVASGAEEGAETFVAAPRPELPGFELQEVLGRGGMGEVWRARQQSLGRTVAVKLLPPRLAKDPEFVTRFEKEATALAALSHPHIVQIIDRGVVGEHYYFVMEYVEGRSLREAMSTGEGLTPQQTLKLLLQVSRAIECAHDKGIIHRDLKPENILLDARGHVKVADFGLAGIRQPDSRLQLTATAVAMGTLNYMAPEQRRDAKNVDGRADLFSLGVMLYEALTGELPLGRFKLPSARVPGLDPRVDAVVERLLETEPAARYANAGEVCAALEVMVSSSSAPALALGDSARAFPSGTPRARSELTRRLRLGWRRVRAGLSVVGGLALLGLTVRWAVGPVSLHVGQDDKVVIGTQGVKVRPGTQPWPPNTEGEVFASANVVEGPGGTTRFEVGFDAGEEELNVHSGEWKMLDGQLQARQGGKETDGHRLVPRAYVAHRYFMSDDFTSEVLMDVKPLGPAYPEEPDAQHFGELAFRIKDLQVSAFAIPEVGMRLSWRYITDAGQEIVGNSAQDLDNMVADEMPLPTHGPFLVRLQLRRLKSDAVKVEAFLNNQLFASKVLPGFQGRVGKVALGCRNLACTFDDLKVRGVLGARPARKVAAGIE